MSSLRTRVAGQLDELTSSGDIGHRSTTILYARSLRRRRIRRDIVESTLATRPQRADRGTAVVTAGVPGAGKSYAITNHSSDFGDFRRLDADVIKDDLLRRAVTDGIYADLLSQPLADGRTIAPRELAFLVHQESVAILEEMRRICISRRENIIIEGTLTWPDAGPRIAAELIAADYNELVLLAIEVPQAKAQQRALHRWWTVRDAGTDPLGGRFIRSSVVAAAYRDGRSESTCLTNAAFVLRRPGRDVHAGTPGDNPGRSSRRHFPIGLHLDPAPCALIEISCRTP